MKIAIPFPVQVLVALGLSAIAATYPMLVFGNREILLAVAAGAALSTLNILLGYLAIDYAFHKPMTTFIKVVIGAMGIRLLILLGSLLYCIWVLEFHTAALTFSLFYFYVLYMTLEILFIQKRVRTKISDDAGTIH